MPASTARLVRIAAIALVATACNNGPTSGTLTVNYQIGLGDTCEERGITSVRVRLDSGEYEEEADCNPSDPIVLTGVAAGNYDVLIHGLDATGTAVMDNLGPPDSDESVEIVGGSERAIDARLADAPAQVQVRWNTLIEGSAAQCSAVQSAFFEVTAYRGANPFMPEHLFECDAPPGYGFRTLPDENRVIDGNTLDGVLVRVLDESQVQIGDDLIFDITPPGPGRIVKIDITCDGPPTGAPTCTGEVEVDAATDTGDASATAGDESGSSG